MKKALIISILLFLAGQLLAQFPAGPTYRIRLGQVTKFNYHLLALGDGAPAFTPVADTNAYTYIDTTALLLYTYSGGSWSTVGGGAGITNNTSDNKVPYYESATGSWENSPFTVDTANNRIGLNDATPSFAFDVTGAINATGNIISGGNFVAATVTEDATEEDLVVWDSGSGAIERRPLSGIITTQPGLDHSGTTAIDISLDFSELGTLVTWDGLDYLVGTTSAGTEAKGTLSEVFGDMITSDDGSISNTINGSNLLNLQVANPAPTNNTSANYIPYWDGDSWENSIYRTTAAFGFGTSTIPTNVNAIFDFGTETRVNIGDDAGGGTNNENGVMVMANANGNNYIDTKTHTGGGTYFRRGSGTNSAIYTYQSVDNDNGDVEFYDNVTIRDKLYVETVSNQNWNDILVWNSTTGEVNYRLATDIGAWTVVSGNIYRTTGKFGFGTSTIPTNVNAIFDFGTETRVNIGDDAGGGTNNENGVMIMANANGNNYIDTKTHTGGKTYFRYGSGTGSAINTSFSLDNSNGEIDFDKRIYLSTTDTENGNSTVLTKDPTTGEVEQMDISAIVSGTQSNVVLTNADYTVSFSGNTETYNITCTINSSAPDNSVITLPAPSSSLLNKKIKVYCKNDGVAASIVIFESGGKIFRAAANATTSTLAESAGGYYELICLGFGATPTYYWAASEE